MIRYRLLIALLSPLIVIHSLWKALQCRQLRYLKQRMGFGFSGIPDDCLWFHCASVGETLTALPLIRELHLNHTSKRFLITTLTPTSAAIVDKQLNAQQQADWLYHAYLPADFSIAVKMFLNRIKPGYLFIIETELWPNLLNACKRRNVVVNIINGRLSPRTTETRDWMRLVYAHTLQTVQHIYARSRADADRFIQLGATAQQVSTAGNLKFAPPDATHTHKQNQTQREYVVVASTHEDEEVQIARAWSALKRDELLVIAPRHPERGEGLTRQLKAFFCHIALRSRNDNISEKTGLYLLDTVGELVSWYADAKLVVMGGSFVEKGGHNILEPAHFSKAIVFGPYMENFSAEAELLLSDEAAVQVAGIDELKRTLTLLLDGEVTRTRLQTQTKKSVANFSTIVFDYAKIITSIVK